MQRAGAEALEPDRLLLRRFLFVGRGGHVQKLGGRRGGDYAGMERGTVFEI